MTTQKGARKTQELRPAEESDPFEQPRRTGLEILLERIARFVGYVSLILLLVVGVSKIAADMLNRPILIDPLILPKIMEDQGYTGSEAANRAKDEIHRIEQVIKTVAF
jgi:hypothetical protein